MHSGHREVVEGAGQGLAGERRMSNSGFLEGKVQMGKMERIRLDW